jgi:hypothetical protein
MGFAHPISLKNLFHGRTVTASDVHERLAAFDAVA